MRNAESILLKLNYSAFRISQSVFGIPGLLFMAGGLSRLPFVHLTPVNWDAVQFVLALDDFDLHAHQPHPPGYILYVALGRLLRIFTGDPTLAFSLLSVLASAISVPLIYWLALEIFSDRRIALGAALLLATSPLALYYGSTGLTYAPELALSLLVAGLAWKARQVSPGLVLAALLGISLGLSGGIRQTSLVVLLPLCAWALWGSKRGPWVAFALSVSVTCILWLVPLLVLSGGPAAYLRENTALAAAVSSRTSLVGAGLDGLAHNLTFEVLGLFTGLTFAVIPIGLWTARVVRFSLSRDLRSFLLWWTAPPLAFYAVTHVGQYGYLLFVLPPFVLLAALCVRVLEERRKWKGEGRKQHRWAFEALTPLICAGLAVLSAGYFLLAQGPATASNIANNEDRWQAIRADLAEKDPANTVLVMGVDWAGPFRLSGYLLPGFHSYAFDDNPGHVQGWLYSAYQGHSNYSLPQPPAQPNLVLPPGVHTVIALDDAAGQLLARSGATRRVALPGGSSLYVLESPGAAIGSLSFQGNKIVAGSR